MREGMYLEPTCHIVGIAPSTAYDWMQRGASGEEPFASFSDALKQAESDAERRVMGQMLQPGDPQWARLATFLERRFRARWGREKRDEAQAETPQPQVIVVQVPKDE